MLNIITQSTATITDHYMICSCLQFTGNQCKGIFTPVLVRIYQWTNYAPWLTGRFPSRLQTNADFNSSYSLTTETPSISLKTSTEQLVMQTHNSPPKNTPQCTARGLEHHNKTNLISHFSKHTVLVNHLGHVEALWSHRTALNFAWHCSLKDSCGWTTNGISEDRHRCTLIMSSRVQFWSHTEVLFSLLK